MTAHDEAPLAPQSKTLQTLVTGIVTVVTLLGAWLARDTILPDTKPNVPAVVVPATPVTPAKPVAKPTGTGKAVVPALIRTGEITGPTELVQGALCTFRVPLEGVTFPHWTLLPDNLAKDLADDEHTLQLSTDGIGLYTVIFAGQRDGETFQWIAQFNIKSLVPPPAPVPATPTGPVKPVTPVTPAIVVETPSVALQTLVAPLKALIAAGDKTKAATLQAVLNDYLNVVKTSPPFESMEGFKKATQQLIEAAAVKAGLSGAFLGFSTNMNTIFDSYFGTEDGAYDKAKAEAYLSALVWACAR